MAAVKMRSLVPGARVFFFSFPFTKYVDGSESIQYDSEAGKYGVSRPGMYRFRC